MLNLYNSINIVIIQDDPYLRISDRLKRALRRCWWRFILSPPSASPWTPNCSPTGKKIRGRTKRWYMSIIMVNGRTFLVISFNSRMYLILYCFNTLPQPPFHPSRCPGGDLLWTILFGTPLLLKGDFSSPSFYSTSGQDLRTSSRTWWKHGIY